MPRPIRVVVVGDVHGHWRPEEDWKALQFLQADVVLFTGDFGCENVHVVECVSNLRIQKAVILGNHDAGYSSLFSQRSLELVEYQFQCLNGQHVAYARLDFPSLGLSIVGGRPFSRGGTQMYQQGLIHACYGVKDMKESARKIYEAAQGTPDGHFVILLGHNGPLGLGSGRNDICGKDWLFDGGDNGDADLAEALRSLKANTQISVPLVVFGHMHRESIHWSGLRKMIKVGDNSTIYLNAAIVPRVLFWCEDGATSTKNSWLHLGSSKKQTGTQHAFMLIEIEDKMVEKISEIWVGVVGGACKIAKEVLLFERIAENGLSM